MCIWAVFECFKKKRLCKKTFKSQYTASFEIILILNRDKIRSNVKRWFRVKAVLQ